MKIKKISERKLGKLMNSVRIRQTSSTNKYRKVLKTMYQPEFDVRMNFERYAEEMKPQEYLKIRNYLSSIEMHDLTKHNIF